MRQAEKLVLIICISRMRFSFKKELKSNIIVCGDIICAGSPLETQTKRQLSTDFLDWGFTGTVKFLSFAGSGYFSFGGGAFVAAACVGFLVWDNIIEGFEVEVVAFDSVLLSFVLINGGDGRGVSLTWRSKWLRAKIFKSAMKSWNDP